MKLAVSTAAYAAVGLDMFGLEFTADAFGNKDYGMRTGKLVGKAKKISKEIQCQACQFIAYDTFTTHLLTRPNEHDEILEEFEKCPMRELARLFMGYSIDIQQFDDNGKRIVSSTRDEEIDSDPEDANDPDEKGIWRLRKTKKRPFYEEINTSDMVYHWRSGAIRDACFLMLRKGDISEDLSERAHDEQEPEVAVRVFQSQSII